MPDVVDKNTGQVVFWEQAAWNAERDLRLMAWNAAKSAVEVAKAAEMEARKAAVDFCFNPNQTSGTERIELGAGYEAKAVKKINYGWVNAADGKTVDRHKINAVLAAIAATGNEGPYIAENLVKWSPELSLTEYKKIAPQYKALIDAVIVTTEGAPTLEIIAPKTKAA